MPLTDAFFIGRYFLKSSQFPVFLPPRRVPLVQVTTMKSFRHGGFLSKREGLLLSTQKTNQVELVDEHFYLIAFHAEDQLGRTSGCAPIYREHEDSESSVS